MLPLISAPFDANGSVLVSGRLGVAEPVDLHPQPSHDAVSIKPSTGADGDGHAGFGDAKLRIKNGRDQASLAAADEALDTRLQALGVSLDGEVTVDDLRGHGDAAGESAGLGFTQPD